METKKQFASFAEFWPFYLSQHQNRMNRRLHAVGLVLALSVCIWGYLHHAAGIVLLALVAGYGPAWIGHFFVEKNRPATLKWPFYSLLGEFRLSFLVLTGRMK